MFSFHTCSPNCRLRVMDFRAFTIWAFVAEGLSSVSRPIPSRSFRRYGTSSTLRAFSSFTKYLLILVHLDMVRKHDIKKQQFTWATSSVCSFWNMRLRASQASPAMSGRHFIPDMRGPMVSREAMERTHSYTEQDSVS